ncbi:MAG: class I SAM-dependent methyltransferase [Acidobacteriota bacterium]|nr:class I SAM-dependent methyltransferase [Acidobacteriota bacterium]
MEPRYDRIGIDYARHRRPDARIAGRIEAALAGARRVLDVGAGTGSYEPAGAQVLAVDPSPVMIAQRPPASPPVVRAVAEALPVASGGFDAVLAVLTVHHWADPPRGLAELCRVAPRRVVLCFDKDREHDFWLVREYLPEIARLDGGHVVGPAEVAAALGPGRVEVVPVPADCTDGFLGAYWRRPERYLDPAVRACISGIARLPASVVDRGVDALRRDLETGRWHEAHAGLLRCDELDLGYRLVVAGP